LKKSFPSKLLMWRERLEQVKSGVLFPLIMFGVAFCCRNLFDLSVGLSDRSVLHTPERAKPFEDNYYLIGKQIYVDLLAIHVNNFTPIFHYIFFL
jgi:hypothetical protein